MSTSSPSFPSLAWRTARQIAEVLRLDLALFVDQIDLSDEDEADLQSLAAALLSDETLIDGEAAAALGADLKARVEALLPPDPE